jgi:hypothetical protein
MSMKLSPLVEMTLADCRILDEGTVKDDQILHAEVKWQHAGMRNNNGRRYRKEILQREMGKLSSLCEQGAVFGAAYHPKTGEAESTDTSHIWRKIWMTSEGECLGNIDILPTTHGKDIQAIIKAGGKLGMSSRGFGTVTSKIEEVDGHDVHIDEVNDDYKLVSPGDFVLNASVGDAGIRKLMEQSMLREAETSDDNGKGDQKMTIEELTKKLEEDQKLIEAKDKEINETKATLTGLQAKVDTMVTEHKKQIDDLQAKYVSFLQKVVVEASEMDGVTPPAPPAPDPKATPPVDEKQKAIDALTAENVALKEKATAAEAVKQQESLQLALRTKLTELLEKEEFKSYAPLISKEIIHEDKIDVVAVDKLEEAVLASKTRISSLLVEAEKAKIISSGTGTKGVIGNPEGEADAEQGKVTLDEQHRLYAEATKAGYKESFEKYKQTYLKG